MNSATLHSQSSKAAWFTAALLMALACTSAAHAQTCNWTAGTAKLTETCGAVGIGITNPAWALDVGGVGSTLTGIRSTRVVPTWGGGAPQATLYLKATLGSGQLADGFGPGILFYDEDVDSLDKLIGRLGAVRDGGDASGNPFGKFTFRLMSSSGEQDRFIISNTEVKANGVPLYANYSADLAEWATVRGSSDPGTVVVVHKSAINEVTPSAKRYDTSVAGVISGRPAIVLSEAGDGKATVATTGRVKVKVVTTNGAIHTGDLLVTSDQAGYAMRSEPVDVAGIKMHRPGTLIGKALEPLEEGEGEVLVLLSLQ